MPSSEDISLKDTMDEYYVGDEEEIVEDAPMPSFSEHMANIKKNEYLLEREEDFRPAFLKTYEPITNLIGKTENITKRNLLTAVLGNLYLDAEEEHFEGFGYKGENDEPEYDAPDDAFWLEQIVTRPTSDLGEELKDWSYSQMVFRHESYLYKNNLRQSVAEVIVVGYNIEKEKYSDTDNDDERMHDFRDEAFGPEMPELKKHIIRMEAKKILEAESDDEHNNEDEYDEDDYFDGYTNDSATPFQVLLNKAGSVIDNSEQSKSTRLGFLKELFSGKSPEESLETATKPLSGNLMNMLLSGDESGIKEVKSIIKQCRVLSEHIDLEEKSYERYKQLINRGNEILSSTVE